MGTIGKRPQGSPLRVLTLALVLALLAALLLAGTALAAAKPGKPAAKAPKGTITTATPSFTWSKAKGAATYELRVYKGKKLQLKKSGLTKVSWQSRKALPTNVSLTWKVRAKGAAGAGAWSKSLTFTVAKPSPEKAITAFSFEGLAPPVSGVVNETSHTIAVNVPYGTPVTNLVPTIAITGASVSPASGVAHDFTSPVTYTVTAANGTTQDYAVTVTVALNAAKAITAFSLQGLSPPVSGVVDETSLTIAVSVPYGTPVTALVPTITTTGASVSPASGVAHDFTSPAVYTVTAADASTQDYTVTVTVAANPAKAITAFSFASPAASGVINETLHTIAITVPHGTNVGALVPTIAITGASVSPASGVAHDFTSPAVYTVTAADASTQDYTVTVTVAANPAKAITAFSFASPAASGVINETLHTIAITVPSGTNVTGLVASFTTTGASVKVGGAPQTSGATPNDFTGAVVTYTVTAADSSTQDYAVTVYYIGKSYQGGIIAYIDGSGLHGLIAATNDQSSGTAWSNIASTAVGAAAQGIVIGTGQANTTAIVGQAGCTSGAAYICNNLVESGYSDWYLPCKDELNELYINQAAIGGLGGTAYYWSSSEYEPDGDLYAWYQFFFNGGKYYFNKDGTARVRAVRSF